VKELRGLFRVPVSDDNAPDDAVDFERSLPTDGSSPRSQSDLALWGQYMSSSAARPLAHWNSYGGARSRLHVVTPAARVERALAPASRSLC
jgi:hypothetical protein